MTGVTGVLAWLAEVTDTPPPPGWAVLGQYGLAGLVIGALATFVLAQWRREVARADRLYEENRALNTANQEKVIPALLASVTAITECTALLREVQHEMQEMQRERRDEYVRMRRDGDLR